VVVRRVRTRRRKKRRPDAAQAKISFSGRASNSLSSLG
jgi:hypothetical protein